MIFRAQGKLNILVFGFVVLELQIFAVWIANLLQFTMLFAYTFFKVHIEQDQNSTKQNYLQNDIGFSKGCAERGKRIALRSELHGLSYLIAEVMLVWTTVRKEGDFAHTVSS